MKNSLRIALLLGALSLAAVPLSGCGGVECGPGTSETDGQCVAEDDLTTEEVCGEGTALVDGACVLDESGCGADTQLNPDTGVCEPVPGYCGEGTTWDSGAEECVTNSDVTCGEGTTNDGDTCVPNLDEVCGPMTSADEQGRCVITADACATGEVLDPNSGDCLATDTYCSPTTAFDADSGTCVPTEDVCDNGTAFDTESGLCLPDACQTGDVLLDGVCVSPAEELAASSDLDETENNHPAFGGTAEVVTLEAMGETAVFTGTIGEPSDLDGDGELDQDSDVFTFDATAGQWLQLAVQSTGLPAPAFVVEGPNGYVRFSPVGRSADPARQLAIPYDGAYTVTVLPALVMQSGGEVGPSGNADWGYVGSIEQIAAPTAADVDLTAANITGSYDTLSDNLFNVTGFSAGDVVSVTVDASGNDAEGILQLWSSATQLEGEIAISEGTTAEVVVPQSGTLLLLVDWVEIDGPALDFELSGAAQADFESLGVLTDDSTTTSTPVAVDGGTSYHYSFSVNAGQVIELAFDNVEGEEVEFWLRNTTGVELLTDDNVDAISDTFDTDYNYWYTASGGTFVLEVTPNSSGDNLTDVAVTLNTSTPNELNTSAAVAGDAISVNISDAIDEDRSAFHLFTTSDALMVSGDVTTPNDEDADVFFLDTANTEIDSHTSSGSVTISDTVIPAAGGFLLQVQASDDIPSYDLNLNFAVPPLLEQEPNDTDAQANAYDIAQTLFGSTSAENEVDVYKFTVPNDLAADEILIVELLSLTSGSDEYSCTLRDSTGADVGTIDTDGDEDGCLTMSTGLLASETYYFEIERMSFSDQDDYEISARVETGVLEVEPNEDDTAATNFDLDLLTAGTDLFGDLSMDTDTDYFSFTLSANRPSEEVITFSSQRLGANPTSTLAWRLLDSSLTELSSGSLDQDLQVTGLTQGTYFIEVTRTSTTSYYTGTYQLSANSEVPVCGNGTVETGETCDDNNTTDGDGCTSTCALGTPTVSVTNNTSGTLDSTNSVVTRAATVSGCTAPVWAVTVDVDITHTWRGDLTVELDSPAATTVRLHNQTGGSDDDIVGNYPETLTVDGPGVLADFGGDTGNGDWELYVQDNYTGSDDGTFNSFTVNVYCN